MYTIKKTAVVGKYTLINVMKKDSKKKPHVNSKQKKTPGLCYNKIQSINFINVVLYMVGKSLILHLNRLSGLGLPEYLSLAHV